MLKIYYDFLSDPASVVSIFSATTAAISAFAAVTSAVYASYQIKQAKKTVAESVAQNKINALSALKLHYERIIPDIKSRADHFEPEAYERHAKPLYDEHDVYRKKLQKVNAEFDAFYDLYVNHASIKRF